MLNITITLQSIALPLLNITLTQLNIALTFLLQVAVCDNGDPGGEREACVAHVVLERDQSSPAESQALPRALQDQDHQQKARGRHSAATVGTERDGAISLGKCIFVQP